jgi:ribose transport system ATP-binding protein
MFELREVTKVFPGVRALDRVSLKFEAGEIHALMGENGAGKSTAIKIMTGVHLPDEGEIRLNGATVVFSSVREAARLGVGIIHQEICAIPDLSVAENIMLERHVTRRFGRIDWPATRAEAVKRMQMVGLNIDPDLPLRDLSAAQKQLVQIARVISDSLRVLLLDEPTSCLTEHEAARLFQLLKELKAKGVALIFVSHKLDEVYAIADRISVLRDGRFVASGRAADVSRDELIRWMIGRTSDETHLGRLSPDPARTVLEAREITVPGKVHGVSFKLHAGEILGFYGLVGSGRTELAKAILGELERVGGKLWVHGAPVSIGSIGEALYRHRIGYVTENRKEEGVFLHDDVRKNLALLTLPSLDRTPLGGIDDAAEVAVAEQYVSALKIKTPDVYTPVGVLSGGNQQKVSIGKWLAADCEILIVDEPTIGVDVAAKRQIHQLIWELAARHGKSLIVISSELAELVVLTNRIIVFREGRAVGEIREIDSQPKSYSDVAREVAPYFA